MRALSLLLILAAESCSPPRDCVADPCQSPQVCVLNPDDRRHECIPHALLMVAARRGGTRTASSAPESG